MSGERMDKLLKDLQPNIPCNIKHLMSKGGDMIFYQPREPSWKERHLEKECKEYVDIVCTLSDSEKGMLLSASDPFILARARRLADDAVRNYGHELTVRQISPSAANVYGNEIRMKGSATAL